MNISKCILMFVLSSSCSGAWSSNLTKGRICGDSLSSPQSLLETLTEGKSRYAAYRDLLSIFPNWYSVRAQDFGRDYRGYLEKPQYWLRVSCPFFGGASVTLSVLAATPLTQAKQDPIFLKYKSIFLAAMSEANAFASNEGFGKIVLTYEPKTPTNYILDHGLPLFERDQPMWELGVDEARGSIAEALPTLMKFIEVVTSNLQAVSSGASN